MKLVERLTKRLRKKGSRQFHIIADEEGKYLNNIQRSINLKTLEEL